MTLPSANGAVPQTQKQAAEERQQKSKSYRLHPIVKLFEVRLKDTEDWFTRYALTASKARYQYLLHITDCCPGVRFQDIEVRRAGGRRPSVGYLEGVEDTLRKKDRVERIAQSRGLPFVRLGMIVEVEGVRGFIVDGNDSSNFDVCFTEGPALGQTRNCHPRWRIRYFQNDGTEIAIPGVSV